MLSNWNKCMCDDDTVIGRDTLKRNEPRDSAKTLSYREMKLHTRD